MEVLMAVAPNGGIAISNVTNNKAHDISGRAYDPFGNTWHWTGRQPYLPAKIVANTLFSEQAPDWVPADRVMIQNVMQPERVIELPEDTDLTIAQRVAALPDDPYLMAVAAARVLIRNMHNGTMTTTFGDESKAYLDPTARTVVPD